MTSTPREQLLEALLRDCLRYVYHRPLVAQIEALLNVDAATARAEHGLTTRENLK